LRYYGPLHLANVGIVKWQETGYADKLDPASVAVGTLILTGAFWISLQVVLLSKRSLARHGWVLFFCLALYVILSALIHRASFLNFSDHEESTAIFAQSFQRFFENGSFFVNSIEGGSHLGVHASYWMFLLYPLYLAFPTIDLFFWITPVAVAVAAYFFHRFARDHLAPTPSLLVTLSFLAYPTIAYQSLSDLHEMAWALPWFFLAVVFFEKERFFAFLLVLGLFLLVKENLALAAFFFGVYALVRRRPIRWIIAPVLISTGWFLVTTGFLIPLAAGDASYGFVARRYGHLGLEGSILQLPAAFLRNPQPILENLFSWHPVKFLYDSLAGAGFVGLLSPFALLAIEPFLENMLQKEPFIISWQSTLIPAVLYVSLVFVLERLSMLRSLPRSPAKPVMVSAAALAILFVNLSGFHLWIIPSNLNGPENKPALEKIITLLPPDARVRVPPELLPHLISGRDVHGFAGYNYGDTKSLDYVVFKTELGDAVSWREDRQVDGVPFQMVYQNLPYVVFKRVSAN
jgi:uncharacterized membrane protein